MKTICILIERNARMPGKTINECWEPLSHPAFASAAEAIDWSIAYNVGQANRAALRVLERVVTDTGDVVDYQLFPHWEPAVRVLTALRATVKPDLSVARETNIEVESRDLVTA